ncbi:preflagellin peptidase FlaK [Methanocalculus alkaliphilus]|uniref:A24 family peptidase C-terminal domain-containing protein n=1 Tax=Methanocalculus alkaliphilus TaxID=768730 RepID=UPI0020A04916|nr:A24 family peptidase C-terminal domain-containing protein [Methanocalculus alkaliphilus]MCP1714809.1 preflagellin peptidase FlaK [Methanocalculus alkaliphilus]
MIPPLIIVFIAVAATFLYGSVLDIRDRRVPFRTWYPMILLSAPFSAYVYYLLLKGDPAWFLMVLIATLIFCIMMYGIAYFGLFGGADAWGLIFIALLIPIFPIEPLLGYSPVPLFVFSVLANALILNLCIPPVLFLYNTIRGNRAPLLHRFIGYPVPAEKLTTVFGFVIEDFEETEDGVRRRFMPFSEAVRRMAGDDRVYTRDLREHPEEFIRERKLYAKAGSVWISYGVPFFIPITAGLFVSFFIGDILFTLITILTGV